MHEHGHCHDWGGTDGHHFNDCNDRYKRLRGCKLQDVQILVIILLPAFPRPFYLSDSSSGRAGYFYKSEMSKRR